MSKKLSRSKRKELREQGDLGPRKSAPRRENEPSSAQRARPVQREEVAPEAEEEATETAAPRAKSGRDRTVLVLVALTALAGLIFWLTQRTPSKDSAKIDVHAPSLPATGSAKP